LINSLHSKTAILIFSLSQEAENINKPFLKRENVATALNSIIVDKVSGLNVDYFHYTEQNQKGDTFAERITNAIAATFDKGYDYVVTVGNDSLGLQKKHLRNAITEVHNKKVVVGPSYDGGFYLLGLHKDQFDVTSFLSLSWKSSRLYSDLGQLFQEISATEYNLPALHDLDSFKDIVRNITALSIKNVKAIQLLQKLLTKILKRSEHVFAKAQKSISQAPFNKGSPVMCN